jgi:hypothetical protein
MRRAEKAMERATKVIQGAKDNIRAERDAADHDYRNTGYDRYYKMIEERDKDIERLDDFVNAQSKLKDTQRQLTQYKDFVRSYTKMLDNFVLDYPGDEYVKQVVDLCKNKMDTALVMAGVMTRQW